MGVRDCGLRARHYWNNNNKKIDRRGGLEKIVGKTTFKAMVQSKVIR